MTVWAKNEHNFAGWYHVYRTSGFYYSGYSYPQEAEEYAQELAEMSGLETCVLVEENYRRHTEFDGEQVSTTSELIEPWRSYRVYARVETLEDLERFDRNCQYPLILGNQNIEIYDDYRE